MCIYLIKQLKDGATVDRMNGGGGGWGKRDEGGSMQNLALPFIAGRFSYDSSSLLSQRGC